MVYLGKVLEKTGGMSSESCGEWEIISAGNVCPGW